MMIGKRFATMSFMLGVLSVGCETMPPAVLEPPVQTAIPPGIYSGEITQNSRQTVSGVEVFNETTTSPYAETVDANGLPLLSPSGDTPVVGLRREFNNADGSQQVFTIESVNASGNKLVIGFRREFRLIDGSAFDGLGQWQYEFIEPDTLTFSESFFANGTTANGSSSTFFSTDTATLSR